MLGFFKKNKNKAPKLPQLVDLDNNALSEGDKVEALRYELGVCELQLIDNKYVYHSIDSDKQVSWLKMIDASTDRQKVKKIVS